MTAELAGIPSLRLRLRHPPEAPRTAAAGQPWSHLETLNLIASYEELWLAANRGHLRAHQWSAVAAAVSSRSGSSTPKTPTQCRHKIEKLRKRYRAERDRAGGSAWPYFAIMDRMERGAGAPPLEGADYGVREEENGDVCDWGRTRVLGNPNELKSRDFELDGSGERGNLRYDPRVFGNPYVVKMRDFDLNGSEDSDLGNSGGRKRRDFDVVGGDDRNPRSWKRRDFDVEDVEEEDSGEDEEDDEEEERPAMSQMAEMVMRFGDGFLRLEKRRMEMMRELKREWMEMERNNLEMVMESQRCLVDMIDNAFSREYKLETKIKSEEDKMKTKIKSEDI